MNTHSRAWYKGICILAALALAMLAGCGGSGDADPAGVFPDSITISDLTGTDSGNVGQTFKMDVTVVVTGGIPADQITYTWEKTSGGAITNTQQTNGDYRSSFSFIPTSTGDITIRVTARTKSGRVAAQAKTVSVN